MQLKTENLGKRFNREWIFRNFTYTFESNQTYAVTGPNGSGKSTLLHTLWGQMPTTSGTLTYYKSNSPLLPEDIFKVISIAAPYMELIDEFTLEEMVNFHFQFKEPVPRIHSTDIYDWMELAHARTKPIGQFSSGMKQRLKLALCFSSNTEVVFFDEPTTNLDKKGTQWYLNNLNLIRDRLVFIASNQEHEYPANAHKINILDLKSKVTSE